MPMYAQAIAGDIASSHPKPNNLRAMERFIVSIGKRTTIVTALLFILTIENKQQRDLVDFDLLHLAFGTRLHRINLHNSK